MNNWSQNFLDPWSHYWTIGEWSNQDHSYSHLFPAGRYRVILIKNDIFILSLQEVTGWFPQNMTFSIFSCRGLQCDSHKTWHFQSFPAGWYLVIPTKHDIFNLSHAGWYRVIPKKHDIFILSLHRLMQGDSHKTWRFHSFPADGYRVIPTKHDIFILSLHRLMQGDSHKTWHFHSFPLQVDTGWFQQNMTFSFFPYRWIQGDSYRTWHFHSFAAQVVTGWFLQNITFSFFPVGGYRVIPTEHDISPGRFLQKYSFSR